MKISTTSFAILFIGATCVQAHMLISLPSTWGLSGDLEVPLSNSDSDWFCHGQTKDTNVVTTLNAGTSISVPIVCGEAIDDPTNGGSICSDDTAAYHGGGGCALSISYNLSPDITDFTMFSVNVDCPKEGQAMIPFEIPDNLPTGNAVCAWTWIPDKGYSAEEMYMNCFNCRVAGGSSGSLTGGTDLVDHLWAVPYPGVGNTENGDRGNYRDVFEDGALSIQVSGSGTTTTETEEEPTPTETEEPTETETEEEPTPRETKGCRRKSRKRKGRKHRLNHNK